MHTTRRRFLTTTAFGLGISAFSARAQKPAPELEPALSPADHVIELFNGRDLEGWYGWLKETHYDDPKRVFTVHNGMLRISGEVPGYIGTRKAYRDYHLIAEYKWGDLTYGSKTVRNSGILLHAIGSDGNPSPWMSSIECQIAQGCVGDFIGIRGKDERGQPVPVTFSSETVLASDGRTRWKKGGKRTDYSGKQFWWSHHEAGFQELIDTKGKNDLESRLGEWTRVECTCRRNRITIAVNGTTVNECFDTFPSQGKILLESEGFEILFRKLELHPLKRAEA
jgi:hypothetical protein